MIGQTMILPGREATFDAAITNASVRQDTGKVGDAATFLTGNSGLAKEIRAYFTSLEGDRQSNDAPVQAGVNSDQQPQGPEDLGRLLRKPQMPGPGAIRVHIGRYRVERILGIGGFGVVYLAYDGQLQRLVAIKVPHEQQVSSSEDAEAYLTEARTVANLDHPHIVPVFDAGSTDEWPCFIVSRYIEGCTLKQRIKDERLTFATAAELVATVAETLHYMHQRGLVHRDIKPSNILIDQSGKPFVVDFGLAIKQEDTGYEPHQAGTPAYMSPEQARGQGHRVDCRSDIFSLGVVLYELLVGGKPFRADSQTELMEKISSFEPHPPRQYDDSIPPELERICLKALAKRASERYSTAEEMANDLRGFLRDRREA